MLDARCFQKLIDELHEYKVRAIGDNRGAAAGKGIVRRLRVK